MHLKFKPEILQVFSCRERSLTTNGSHIPTSLLIGGWIFPADAFEQFALKFCQRMTGVSPL